jgi:hypothetical protein
MKKKLIAAYNNVMKAESVLSIRLQILANIASEIYGEELSADLCEGPEIEFRHEGDAFDVVRLEDILSRL